MRTNILLASALEHIPRLLGQLNRNQLSASYGSFDRAFWHYRTNDISCARLQEAVYALALLYTRSFEGNEWFEDPHLLAWIEASLCYTARLQHPDGSFDEWYPFERSFVATCFVTTTLARTLETLPEGTLTAPTEALVRSTLASTATWIVQGEQESLVCNQEAGGIVALLLVGQLLGRDDLCVAARRRADAFMAAQDSEGWWSEYGGPDLGYLSLTIDYLATYWEKTKDERMLTTLERALQFMLAVLPPDGSAGGEIMARNTEYIIPSGIAQLARVLPIAQHMVAQVEQGLANKTLVGPSMLDDRYLCYILSNWLVAGLAQGGPFVHSALDPLPVHKQFEHAGLVVHTCSAYQLLCAARKGGVFRVVTPSGESYFDSGIAVVGARGTYFANISGVTTSWQATESSVTIRGSLTPLREPLMATLRAIVFKFFQVTMGRHPWVQRKVKRFLRRGMIHGVTQEGPTFVRQLFFSETELVVRDEVWCAVDERVIVGDKSSYTFIPSAKYYTKRELSEKQLLQSSQHEVHEGGRRLITRSFRFVAALRKDTPSS